jgi:hypothetical protein
MIDYTNTTTPFREALFWLILPLVGETIVGSCWDILTGNCECVAEWLCMSCPWIFAELIDSKREFRLKSLPTFSEGFVLICVISFRVARLEVIMYEESR